LYFPKPGLPWSFKRDWDNRSSGDKDVDKEYEKCVHIERQNVEVGMGGGGETFTDIM
jgi:hypothetical protein